MSFKLDQRLQNDTFILDENDERYLLLMNNAAVHWFILVPKVSETEWHALPDAVFSAINLEAKELASKVKATFGADKMNVAAIGNVVEQLHIHVIGRKRNDYCWPDVVWGTKAPEQYTAEQAAEIKNNLL